LGPVENNKLPGDIFLRLYFSLLWLYTVSVPCGGL